MEMNKSGFLSNFIVFFGATIAIILILTIYIIGGGIIKKLDNKNYATKVGIYDEKKVEIDNIFNYSNRFILLNNVKVLIAKGENTEKALQKMKETLNTMKQKNE